MRHYFSAGCDDGTRKGKRGNVRGEIGATRNATCDIIVDKDITEVVDDLMLRQRCLTLKA